MEKPQQPTTREMIEKMAGTDMLKATEQQRYVFRQALQALVVLAKVEKMMEMKRDVARAIGIYPQN